MEPLTRPAGAPAPGTVRVDIRTRRGVEPAWLALADPTRLADWFGGVEPPWQTGRTGRIDFGDGDFFDVLTHAVDEPRLIDFEWSFLGLGPPARVRWTVAAAPDGATVTVVDSAADRTAAEADQLLAGWTDFFQRLERYLATGRPSRYLWRDDIDGSVDLPGHAGGLLAPGRIETWLPIATDGFGPRWFFVVDEDGPRRFRLTDWRTGAAEVRFAVELPEARRTTTCLVTLTRTGMGLRLSVTHAGWHGLGLPDRRALLLRRRFTAAWVAALHHARDLTCQA